MFAYNSSTNLPVFIIKAAVTQQIRTIGRAHVSKPEERQNLISKKGRSHCRIIVFTSSFKNLVAIQTPSRSGSLYDLTVLRTSRATCLLTPHGSSSLMLVGRFFRRRGQIFVARRKSTVEVDKFFFKSG